MQPSSLTVSQSEELTNHNAATLKAYNTNVEAYLENTPSSFSRPHSPLIAWVRCALSQIPKDGRILEVGSGSGRDADFIEHLGYDITRSDGAIAFVNLLRSRGHHALYLNLLTDQLPLGYKMIFANAVLPHFDEEETVVILKKMFLTLPPGGVAAINVKEGVGSCWTTEKLIARRYVHFWDPTSLKDVAKNIGFEIIYSTHGAKGDLPSHIWTHLILKKPF